MEQFKATIYRRGCTDETIYGTKLENIRARAIKCLSKHIPTTEPEKAILYYQIPTKPKPVWQELERLYPTKKKGH